PGWITVCHAPDREYGWRGSMAAALQTVRHAHNERVRQSIQPSTCRHGWSGVLPPGQLSTTAPIVIMPADMHVVDTSYG
ncbi:hypothetical protein, partial [Chloroflexus sp.]|uniref:hypothetical protein n=1 Tax=Chloroflexus sp. TaxID=1904827 RepID=UPI00404AB83A